MTFVIYLWDTTLAGKHIDYAAIFGFTQSIAAAPESDYGIRKPEFASHITAPVALQKNLCISRELINIRVSFTRINRRLINDPAHKTLPIRHGHLDFTGSKSLILV